MPRIAKSDVHAALQRAALEMVFEDRDGVGVDAVSNVRGDPRSGIDSAIDLDAGRHEAYVDN